MRLSRTWRSPSSSAIMRKEGRPSRKCGHSSSRRFTTRCFCRRTRLPLDLDFIYGSLEGSPQAFCPLDGQQRLTTLFLLHWYLACKDGRSEGFQTFIRRGQQSRFTYKVRPSSKEFFDAM